MKRTILLTLLTALFGLAVPAHSEAATVRVPRLTRLHFHHHHHHRLHHHHHRHLHVFIR